MFVAACAGSRPAPTPIPTQSLALSPGQSVVIAVTTGQVVIGPSTTGRLEVGGQQAAPAGATFGVTTTPGEVRVEATAPRSAAGNSTPPVFDLQLLIPAGTPVRVETFDATVRLEDYSGDLTVDSTAGGITARGLSGSASLRSGRGDVTLEASTGDFVVLGEHGILSISGVAGQVAASTIMGTIRWAGPAGQADDVHLETDHGPVEVSLAPHADLTVEAATTSGPVTCPNPREQDSARACRLTLGTGASHLAIRTVSGAIVVQQSPGGEP